MVYFHREYSHLGVELDNEHGEDWHVRNSQFLHLPDPTLLAALVAYCSGRRQQVFLRGSTENHPFSVPSLFRDKNRNGAAYCPDKCIRLWDAYQNVLASLRKELAPKNGKSRWRRPNLGAVLQHYGIKTPWLDVVRNLQTAIWCATHELAAQNIWRPIPNKNHGWISLYSRRPRERCGSLDSLVIGDLWGDQSSRHFRPHAQQGLSLAMQKDSVPCPSGEQDFNHYRIAQVRFPNRTEWELCGPMFTPAFLFPPESQDDSLKELNGTKVQNILDRARTAHTTNELNLGTLGRITHYS